jgi:hypothetical protein
LKPITNSQIDPSRIAELERHLAAEAERRIVENKLASYRPYKKQPLFHSLGAEKRERGFFAANQSTRPLHLSKFRYWRYAEANFAWTVRSASSFTGKA